MPKIDRKSSSEGQALAVNLYDLMRLSPVIRQCLIGDKLNLSRDVVIRVDKDRPDETAVPFACDLTTAAAACDVMRANDRKAGDHPTRVYLRRATVWKRLPGDAILTLIDDGRARLNPQWFKVTPTKAVTAPAPVRFQFKR